MGDNFEINSLSNGVRNVVLVGRTGNGKSATGNSILGRKAFKSSVSSSGVTKTCEMHRTVLQGGQIVNVIDTPGLFDFSDDSEFVGKEIVKCVDLAKDGIHAILLVFSVRTRFSREEEDAIRTLQGLFGGKIIDYMIVVFTGGDELEDTEKTFEDYLGDECPEPLKEILRVCENRCVLFDNKTTDEIERTELVGKLFYLVNSVIVKNGGQPYTAEIFANWKKDATKLHNQQVEENSKREISELKKQMQGSFEEQLKGITEMIDSNLKMTTKRLEQQLTQENAARLKAEADARLAQSKSNDEIQFLKDNLKRAKEETQKLRN